MKTELKGDQKVDTNSKEEEAVEKAEREASEKEEVAAKKESEQKPLENGVGTHEESCRRLHYSV